MTTANDDQGAREFAILIFTIFVSMLGVGIVLPLLPFFGLAFDANPWQVMALFSCYSLGTMFGEPFWGRLSDRVGRRPVLLVTSLAYGVSFALLAFSPNFTVALLLRFVGGLGSANMAVVQSIISDVTPRHLLTKRLSKYWVSFQLGLMIGPVAGGVLTSSAAGPEGFRAPLLFAAFLAALSTAGTFFFVKESRFKPRGADGVQSTDGALQAVRSRSVILLLIIQTFIVGVAFRGVDAVFALWSQIRFQWQPIDVGLCIAAASLVTTVCQLTVLPYLGQRLGETIALMCVICVSGMFLLMVPLGSNFPAITILMTCYMLCAAFCSPYTTALIIQKTDVNVAGRIVGLNNSAAAFARVTGPMLSAVAFQHIGVNSPFYLAALLMLPGLALVSATRRR
jgi:DHA1 family tetracycline resistance protein-like MFS transporter